MITLTPKKTCPLTAEFMGFQEKNSKPVDELLKFTKLDEKAVKRHVSKYSGGMKRRVNIAYRIALKRL